MLLLVCSHMKEQSALNSETMDQNILIQDRRWIGFVTPPQHTSTPVHNKCNTLHMMYTRTTYNYYSKSVQCYSQSAIMLVQ